MQKKRIYKRYHDHSRFTLYNGDYARLLETIPDNSVDLIVTSPPYCIGKPYDETCDVNDFKKQQADVLDAVYRKLSDSGSLCWQVGYHVMDRFVTPLDFAVHEVFSSYDLTLRNRIIWSFGHGPHCKKRFSGRHEIVMWYTKGTDYFFDLDKVRVPQKYPGKRAYKGAKRGQFSGNPRGKNPSDVWEFPNVKSNHVEKTAHPCQFPVALPLTLIRALCPSEGLVLDPFMGSGSTAVASWLGSTRFVGAELKEEYYDIAYNRLSRAIKGNERYRSPEKPVEQPEPSQTVAARPQHFSCDYEELLAESKNV